MRKRLALLVALAAFALVSMGANSCGDTGSSGSNDQASPSGDSANPSGSSKPDKPSGPHYTVSQQNAIDSAKNYLDTAGFSKKGLIEQLSSSSGEQFPRKDAVFAVKHLHVNWDQQAVRSAKNYLDTSSFSCQGLIEQLSSSSGDGFTQEQAQYAAKKVGLC